MIKLLSLLQNENMKIYRRLRTWILIGILIAISCSFSIISKWTDSGSNEGWEIRAQARLSANQAYLAENTRLPVLAQEEIRRSILLDQYRLEHDIPPSENTLWGMVMSMSVLIQLVTIFTVVIAADIVAGEFAAGTIKLLLIRPAGRSKILLSKYISVSLFSLLLLVVLFASSFLVNGLLYQFSDIGAPYLHVGKDMVVEESSMVLHVLSTYGLKCIELIMIVTLAFMISTVFRSSSLAISMSLLFLFLGQAITNFLSYWSWGRFWLFANTDLTQYIEGKPLMEGMNMTFSIMVLVAYFLLFNFLSWSIFQKRDVAA
ncbi:ABC transporter permease [Paenibacillus sp. YN15]|uniref:ABC transporter permease n=1 Tax=Paenibacillus sp. YN15 TaxID=1742774 RepID=UPI001C65A7BE|nr:ABC transporter permease [Paenibacillus sp. YN15]